MQIYITRPCRHMIPNDGESHGKCNGKGLKCRTKFGVEGKVSGLVGSPRVEGWAWETIENTSKNCALQKSSTSNVKGTELTHLPPLSQQMGSSEN